MSKTSGSGTDAFSYAFECDGIPCTKRTIEAEHLSFGNMVDFTDVTSVAFQGMVGIGGVKDNAGNLCPLESVKVCAINHYGRNEQLACSETDTFGML